MRNALGLDVRYSFYGNIYDTPYVSFNIEHNRNNLKQTGDLIARLFAGDTLSDTRIWLKSQIKMCVIHPMELQDSSRMYQRI